jgi:aspartyl-tRNA(Asn)/glutamyl-tRNA(Gln) amidotransferase subunit A
VYKNHSEKIDRLRSGELSLVQNVNEFFQTIEKKKNLNAFNFLFEEEAKNRAQEIEIKIKSGKFGKLAGMVIAIKDVLAYNAHPLTCSSKMLSNFKSIYTATSVQKLIDEDAIIIGKTNCDEFAMGSSNENSFFGPVLNPHNTYYVPGGSSGGSAVAVAAKLCDTAIGTDTGGSIRQPAAFCGVYGLKPTYGLVSRFGLTAYASSLDSIGPIANDIEDISKVLDVISGWDEKDSTSFKSEQPVFPDSNLAIKSLRIGIPKEYYSEGLDSEIEGRIRNIIADLRNSGFVIKEISLPLTEYTIAAYYILATAEASSNLARYDGIRFGFRTKTSKGLTDMYVNSRTEGFGNEVKRRIMLGTYVLSAGYYDAYYLKAQKVRRLIKEDFDRAFSDVDLLITPTTPTTAFKLAEKSNDPLQMYLSDIFTVSANLAGIPGINIPVGMNSESLPIGLQVLANRFQESKLLAICDFIKSNLFKQT